MSWIEKEYLREYSGAERRYKKLVSLFKVDKPLKDKGLRESWRRDLNPRPADYKSAALPTELRQHLFLYFT